MAKKPNIKLFEFSLEKIHKKTGLTVVYLQSVKMGHQPVNPTMVNLISRIYRRNDLFDEVGE